MNAPNPTKAMSHQDTLAAPRTPIPTAPARATAARAQRIPSEIRVRSGRPRSSSSACAQIPTPRKNPTTLAPSLPPSSRGATAAPITT